MQIISAAYSLLYVNGASGIEKCEKINLWEVLENVRSKGHCVSAQLNLTFRFRTFVYSLRCIYKLSARRIEDSVLNAFYEYASRIRMLRGSRF